MDAQDVEQSVLHLAYILSTKPDTSGKDSSQRDSDQKRWEKDANAQHGLFYRDISGKLDRICIELKAAFITAILENDLEEDKSVKKNWPVLKKLTGIEFITQQPDSVIGLLERFTKKGNDTAKQFIDFLQDCISKYSRLEDQNNGEDLILNKTILISKLYLLLQYTIQLLKSSPYLNDEFDEVKILDKISGPLWEPGGIENFKQKRKALLEKLKGKRQEYIQDDRLWNLALNKILYSKMVSFRGFGGYGKTTLARELVIYLIAKETERFFDEYHLISFKGEEQGDFDPATGKKVEPTHNMDIEHPTYDNVINHLFFKLSKKIDPQSIDSELELKESVVIDYITSKSCLVVLDNFEDIDGDKRKAADLAKFNSFFTKLKQELRDKGQTTSCILITSRADEDAEAMEIFESVDLGGANKIDLKITARKILTSYLNYKATYDEEISGQKLQKALDNINKRTYTCSECGLNLDSEDEVYSHITEKHTKETRRYNRGTGSTEDVLSATATPIADNGDWDELITKGPDEKTKPEVSNEILRYPIVINYIASEMLRTGDAPRQIVSDFIRNLNSDKLQSEDEISKNLVKYVVSKSYDTRLDEKEKALTEKLLREYYKNNRLELATIIEILGVGNTSLLTKLRDMKFLEPVGVSDNEESPAEYTFPPLIAGYIRSISEIEIDDASEDINSTLKITAGLLDDNKSDNLDDLLDYLNLFIENNALSLLSEIGAANLLQNSQKEILTSDLESRKNWLHLNEYIESNINFDFGTDKNTRSTAAGIISKDLEHLKLADYHSTILSLLEQIGFTIKDDSIIDIIEEYFMRKEVKKFPSENSINFGDIIEFKEDIVPELLFKSTVTLFKIKDDKNDVRFAISGNDVNIHDVCKGQIIVLGKEGLAYRIRQVKAKPKANQDSENSTEVIGLVLENDIITSRFEAGFIAIRKINRLLRKDITIDKFKNILEEDSRFIVNSVAQQIWLVKRKPEPNDWRPVTEACGLPSDIVCYLYVFEMMRIKINSNSKILILEYDKNFVNTCVRYIKSHGIKDINTTKLKRVFEFMSEVSPRERTLTFNYARNVEGFINEAKLRLKKSIINKLGSGGKNTRKFKPYVPDLIEDIENNLHDLDQDIVSNLKEYSSTLRQQKNDSNSESNNTGTNVEITNKEFLLKHEEVIRPFISSLTKSEFVGSDLGNFKKIITQKIVDTYPHLSKSAVRKEILSKASLGSNNDKINAVATFKKYLKKILETDEFWNRISQDSIIMKLEKSEIAKLLEKYLN